MFFLRRLIRFTFHSKMGLLFPCRSIGVELNIGAYSSILDDMLCVRSKINNTRQMRLERESVTRFKV